MCTQDPISSQFTQLPDAALAQRLWRHQQACDSDQPGLDLSLAAAWAPSGAARDHIPLCGPSRDETALSPCTQLSVLTRSQEGSQGLQEVFREPVALLRKAALHVAEKQARTVLGWERLRAFQRRAVEAWAAGRHCFLLSGTGSGKTGCFVLPALVARCWDQPGDRQQPPPVALVVSPLVALMKDQERRLKQQGVKAAVCSPQCDDPTAWQRAVRGEVDLLYMSPELLIKKVERGELQQLLRVSLLAIDEAHCVSEWGFHFRPEYGQLRSVIAAISSAGYGGRPPPVICVTATCTSEVRGDVLRSLALPETQTDLVTGTMNRPNLYFAVEECADQARMQKRILELCATAVPGSAEVESRRALAVDGRTTSCYSPTVIYTQTKRDCDHLVKLLNAGGVRTGGFNSSLSTEVKNQVQDDFHHSRIQVVVATVAFGMGIDKSDVRRVLHFGLPSSLEAYSQESGRAGRDGKPACCVILFTPLDRSYKENAILGKDPMPGAGLHRSLVRLQRALQYCRDRRFCRRLQLLEYLGEEPCSPEGLVSSQPSPSLGTPGFCAPDPSLAGTGRQGVRCGRCDVCCAGPSRGPRVQDLQRELVSLLQTIASAEHRESFYSRQHLIEAVQTACPHLRVTKQCWLRVVDAAVSSGFLHLRCVQGVSSVLLGMTELGKLRASRTASEAFPVDIGGELTSRASLQMPSWVPLQPLVKERGDDENEEHLVSSLESGYIQSGSSTSKRLLSVANRGRQPSFSDSQSSHDEQAERLLNYIDGLLADTAHLAASKKNPSPLLNRSGGSGNSGSIGTPPETVPSQIPSDECLQLAAAEATGLGKTPDALLTPCSRSCSSSGTHAWQSHSTDNGKRDGPKDEMPARPFRRLRRCGSSGQPPDTVPSQAAEVPEVATLERRVQSCGSTGQPTDRVPLREQVVNADRGQHLTSACEGIADTVLDSLAWQPLHLGHDIGAGGLEVVPVTDVQQMSGTTAEVFSRTEVHHFSGSVAAQTRERIPGTIPDSILDSIASQPHDLGCYSEEEAGQLEVTSGTDAHHSAREAAEHTKEMAASPLQPHRRLKPGQASTAVVADCDEASPLRADSSEPPPTVPSQPGGDDDHRRDRSEHPFFAHCRDQASKPPVIRIDSGSPVGKMQHPVRAYFAQFPEHLRSARLISNGASSSSWTRPQPSRPAPSSKPAPRLERRPAHTPAVPGAAAAASKPAPRLELRPAHAPATTGAVAAPQQAGKRRKRVLRTRSYSMTERENAPPLLKKLMECADFDSNVRGGARTFNGLLQEATNLASPRKRRRLDEVRQIFDSKTKGLHGCKLDELIDEWRDEVEG